MFCWRILPPESRLLCGWRGTRRRIIHVGLGREVKPMPQRVFIVRCPYCYNGSSVEEFAAFQSMRFLLGFPLTLIDIWVSGVFMQWKFFHINKGLTFGNNILFEFCCKTRSHLAALLFMFWSASMHLTTMHTPKYILFWSYLGFSVRLVLKLLLCVMYVVLCKIPQITISLDFFEISVRLQCCDLNTKTRSKICFCT